MIIVIISILLMLLLAFLIIFPPSTGRLLKEIPGGISERTKVTIDGEDISLFINGEDTTKPVMLILGGGPGIPQYFLEDTFKSGLEKDFVVVYFDYRNTASNYNPKTDISTLTTERYLDDVQAITDYLIERFKQEKIYLMAHSFGTYLGIQTAYNHPEKYYAYFAMAQMVDQYESEKIAYEYMYQQYSEQGNQKRLKEMDKYPILTDESAMSEYFGAMIRDKAMHELGVGTTHDMKGVISGVFFPSLRCKAYTQRERINIWKAKVASRQFPVVNEVLTYSTMDNVKKLEIPIYFLAGKYDYTCAYPLQKEYYEMIEAPDKEFFTYENSAHSPLYEESELVRKDIQKTIAQ